MMPPTTERVMRNTQTHVNAAIDDQILKNVAHYAGATPGLISHRLNELDREWDVERLTETAAGVLLLIGAALTAMTDILWLILVLVVAGCLLLHGLIGWTPGLLLIRRLGFRTETEIARERYALKALRGDFKSLAVVVTPAEREDWARFEDEGGPVAPDPGPESNAPEAVEEPEAHHGHGPLGVEKLEGRQESGRDAQDEDEEDEPDRG